MRASRGVCIQNVKRGSLLWRSPLFQDHITLVQSSWHAAASGWSPPPPRAPIDTYVVCTAVFGMHVVGASARVWSLPGGLLPSQHRRWSIVFRVLFKQTNKQKNKSCVVSAAPKRVRETNESIEGRMTKWDESTSVYYLAGVPANWHNEGSTLRQHDDFSVCNSNCQIDQIDTLTHPGVNAATQSNRLLARSQLSNCRIDKLTPSSFVVRPNLIRNLSSWKSVVVQIHQGTLSRFDVLTLSHPHMVWFHSFNLSHCHSDIF